MGGRRIGKTKPQRLIADVRRAHKMPPLERAFASTKGLVPKTQRVTRWGVPLTPAELAFILAYLACGRQVEAYLTAGFPPSKTQGGTQSRVTSLATKPYIQKALMGAILERTKPLELSADRVLREIARIAHSDLRDFFDKEGNLLQPHQWPDHAAGAVASYSFDAQGRPTIKLWDKVTANRLLAEYFQLVETQRNITEIHVTADNLMHLSDAELAQVTQRLAEQAVELAAEAKAKAQALPAHAEPDKA